MKRTHHVLKKPKGDRRPRYVIYVDTETKQIPLSDNEERHEMFLGVAQFVDYQSKKTESELIFYKPAQFWDWAVSKIGNQKTLYLFAHNMDYDFRILEGFTHLERLGFYPHSLIFESPPVILKYGTERKEKGKVVFTPKKNNKPVRKYIQILDSLNYFRESLAALGDTLGIPKLKMPDTPELNDVWIEYCRRDVVVLRKTMERFWQFLDQNDFGPFGVTLAKQAFNTWRYKFLSKIVHIHTDHEAITLERESYFGGRVECFYIGHLNGQVYSKLDINSMYPHQMRTRDVPIKFIRYFCVFNDSLVNRLRKLGLIIAKVKVRTTLPLVPVRQNTRLIFPVGEFETTLCQPELDLLDELGQSYEIQEFAYYQKANIFREYVDAMYTLRQQFKEQGAEQYQYFTKLLMNSLYGKLGQRNPEADILGHDGTRENWVQEIYDMDTKKTYRVTCIHGQWYSKGEMKEGYDSMVAIPSFITSYSRAYLARLIHQAGWSNTYYCDTDSLIVNSVGLKNLESHVDEKQLGALKKEGECDSWHVYNLKDYEFNGDIKIKGISKKARKIDETTYEVVSWEHFNGAAMRSRPETVVTRTHLKILARRYEKGIVQADGRVAPFAFIGGKVGSYQNS